MHGDPLGGDILTGVETVVNRLSRSHLTGVERAFKMLNVRSTEDLKADARIRDAAIALFGSKGIQSTTIREIAEEAGASPGLVIHHFGSKEGLRAACDDKVIGELERIKMDALAESADIDFAALGQFNGLVDYLSATLIAGGDGADEVFNRFCDLFDTVLSSGQLALRPVADREAAVATMVAYACGAVLLGPRLARRLGGDKLTDPIVYARYAASALEMFTRGLLVGDGWLADAEQTVAAAMTADPDPPGERPSGHTSTTITESSTQEEQ